MYDQRQQIQKILDGEYNTKEKIKINGEVFTPFKLIDEMLDLKSEEYWKDSSKIILDPCAGLGNFHAIVVERLMANGISYKHIIEKQLYFVELNPESVELTKKIFNPENKYKMNIVCADTLDKDHSGWDEVGYMWDDEDKEIRQEKKKVNNRIKKFGFGKEDDGSG